MSKKSASGKNNKSIPSILEKGEENKEMRMNASPAIASHLTNNYLDEVRQTDISKKKTSYDIFQIIKYLGSFLFFGVLTSFAIKFYLFSDKKKIENDTEK